jgi:hypothetical protein
MLLLFIGRSVNFDAIEKIKFEFDLIILHLNINEHYVENSIEETIIITLAK